MKFYTAKNYTEDLRRPVVSKKTHGMSHTLLYKRWETIKRRCLKENSIQYQDYGGRGIGICDRWLSFENFYEDMGEVPFPIAEIDRIDNEKGYFKENCKWSSRLQNSHNKRSKNRKSGLPTGVYCHPSYKNPKYSASIKLNGKAISLGTFATINEASEAYQRAKREIKEVV